MLVLKRKQHERIRIGADIIIDIVAISENQVKIGIEAPEDVKILREEIYEIVKQHTIEAAQVDKGDILPVMKELNVNKINKRL